MKQVTVWLNTHFNCIQLMRDADAEKQLRIVASYPSRKYADALLSDAFELEPKLSDAEYVRYALDFVKRHSVDVFLPGRRVMEIARHKQAFEAVGVKVVLAASADTLSLLDNKGLFYDCLADSGLVLPDYAVAKSSEQFLAAVNALQERHAVVCFKPTVGIFGFGFRVIETDANRHLLFSIDRALVTDLPGAIKMLEKSGSFQEQIVLEYLPGEERSVDCLADEGRLLHCVVRRKLDDGSRVLERFPALEEQTALLVQRLRLHGLFNVQFKDRDGEPLLLEINARMSGGVVMSCLWGMVFPYWAVRLALDPACVDDLPAPGHGTLRVAELTRAVILE
ncbi:MAG: ATP-grasp domain-containing protein [Cyanobacteria bacterium SZAS LIN-5]|nr:ATP-grasp domain-containing protein [Cyanobacteria bacterium SZAS LIN-5]